MFILLVDDDSFFRSAVKAILQKEGFQIIEAGDGIDGYEIVKESGASIDLLLTDIQMPRMDGLSLAESVKELHPRIAHSDDVDQSFRSDADQNGAKRRWALSV